MGWPLNGDGWRRPARHRACAWWLAWTKTRWRSSATFLQTAHSGETNGFIELYQISTSLDKSSLHIPFQEPVISSRSILKLELVSILKKSSLGRPLREAHGGSWWNSSERSWSHLEIGELSELHEAGCTDGLTMKYHEMGSSSWDSIDSMSLLRCAIDIPLIDIILIHLVAINWFNWWCPTPNPDPGIPRARPRQGQLQ